jgi:peptide/nickel transport system substrate-binding protein
MKKLLIIPAALIIFFLAGCSGAGGSSSVDLIKIADDTGDWGYPSPYGMYSRGPGYIRMSMIFDTLVWKEREGRIIPMLAENYSYNENSNMFTFNLREDVSWHDGESFDAADVVFTFDYIKKHPWVWVDSGVVKSAEAVDDYTVNIKLASKYAPFLENVAGTLPVLPQHIWDNIGDPLNYAGSDAVTGTGPFRLRDYNSAEGSYLYEANTDYYLGNVNVESIAFVKVSDETVKAMLENGEIDAGPIPCDVVSDIGSDFAVEEEPPIWAAKLIINHNTNEILKQKAFRQALAYAIDTESIVKISRRGFADAGSAGLIPPANSNWYNEDTPQYGYDISKARELIEGLGWIRGDDGYYYKDGRLLELELAVSPGDFERDGQVVRENLEDAGIKTELVSYESKTLDSMIGNWEFDLAISGHGGLGGDPESLNRVITGDDFNSARYFGNERLVELLESQVMEMDRDTRKEMVYEIQEIYAAELPTITLYYPKWYWAHNTRAGIFYTEGGVAIGIPVPVNKIAFIDM